MFEIHTILHPTDFSERSDCALDLAAALARDYDAGVIVLHVAPPPLTHGELVARRQPNGYHDELKALLHRRQAPGLTALVRHRLEEGQPAETILRVAREVGCDLIVMGTHGRSGLGRLLMGSVAEEVVRRAVCPVVTVRGPMLETANAPGKQHEEAGKPAGARAASQ